MDLSNTLLGVAGFELARSSSTLDNIEDQLQELAQAARDAALAADLAQAKVVEPAAPVLIDASELQHEDMVTTWEEFIGQQRVKDQLAVHILSARERMEPLDHVLLASGMPGVGKTTLARLIAGEMWKGMKMLVPPFHAETLYAAAKSMEYGDILFIDEIHRLAENGPKAAENLLHMLEENRLYLDSGVVQLEKFTVVGATTDAEKLPETIVDRFPIKPRFEKYSDEDMVRIVNNFRKKMQVSISPDAMVAIARASRSTPRIAREFVVAARDLSIALGRLPSGEEILAFKDTDASGLTGQHKEYLINLFRYFGAKKSDGTMVYSAGEAAMATMLREPKQGIRRIERYLLEQGLIDRGPQGRRLTTRGLHKVAEILSN